MKKRKEMLTSYNLLGLHAHYEAVARLNLSVSWIITAGVSCDAAIFSAKLASNSAVWPFFLWNRGHVKSVSSKTKSDDSKKAAQSDRLLARSHMQACKYSANSEEEGQKSCGLFVLSFCSSPRFLPGGSWHFQSGDWGKSTISLQAWIGVSCSLDQVGFMALSRQMAKCSSLKMFPSRHGHGGRHYCIIFGSAVQKCMKKEHLLEETCMAFFGCCNKNKY